MPAIKGQTVIGKYGEALFRRYLVDRDIPFEYEPALERIDQRIDFVLAPAQQEKIYVEVKTIYNPPPTGRGGQYFDPYPPIRSEIAEGKRKFRKLPETLNAIALVSFPGSFVDIETPYVMLGAMYGDAGYQIPFDTQTGVGDSDAITETFVLGRGLMVRKEGPPRNSRLTALISVHSADPYFPQIPDGGMTIGEVGRLLKARVEEENFVAPHVTVWDNAAAKRLFPNGLFEGPMDARWSYDGEAQFQSFVGPDRRTRQVEALKAGRTRY